MSYAALRVASETLLHQLKDKEDSYAALGVVASETLLHLLKDEEDRDKIDQANTIIPQHDLRTMVFNHLYSPLFL